MSRHITDRISQFDLDAGGSVPISQMDMPCEDLIDLAETEKEEDAVLEDQHYALLYRYRNYLLHEWREPGSSMEFDSLTGEAYYHGYVNSAKWHLVYPMSLFVELYQNAIAAFRQHLTDRCLNPYDYVSDASRW